MIGPLLPVLRILLSPPQLLFALVTALLLHSTHALDLPDVRLEAVGQLGFAGDYAGISPYKSIKQFESISDPGAIILLNNDTYELLGTATDGQIFATCLVPSTADATTSDLYVGGSFTTLNGTFVNRIARYNPTHDTFETLDQGLDGPVYALYCDTDAVYVGGDFTVPVGATNDSLPSFGGHAAIWHTGNRTWGPVPWRGFNGPVYTITRNALMNTILFGGRFEATGDGYYFNAISSQAVNLGAPTQVSSGNGALAGNFSDPSNAVCQSNQSGNSQPWLLQDGVPGYWDANFAYPIQPSVFRISNVRQSDYGTRTFSIITLGTNEYFELSYVDPTTQQVTTCTTDCQLSNDANVEYQDFTVLNSMSATGIRVQIDSWYGQGGGLSNVQIFQSDIAVYAHTGASGSASPCASTPSASTNTTGNWEDRFVYGTYQNFMTATFPASELTTSNTSVTYSPYVPVQGQYAVYATTPGCIGSSTCNQRTQVDLTMQFTPGGESTTLTIDQTNYDDKTTLIYSGFVAASTSAFQPSITLAVAQNATAPASSSTVSIVAESIQFIRNGTNATLVSILEYSPSNFTQNITPAWHPLAEQLTPGSIVRSVDATTGNLLYIGGQFSGLNSTYRGAVSYDYRQGNGGAMVPLNGGVNGTVYDLKVIGSSLFVAGEFDGTLTAPSESFNNVAEFDISSSSWNAIGMGVDGAAANVVPSADNATVTFSGNFSHILQQPTPGMANIPSFGNAAWNITERQWAQPKSLIVGQLVSSHALNETTQILAGGILGAQTYRADDAAVMDVQQIWSPYTLASNSPINGTVHAGVFWHNVTSDGQNKTVVIMGGRFTTNNNVSNLALYQDGTWRGLGELDGEVSSLHILRDTLYIGGRFHGTVGDTRVTSFAIYDLAHQTAQDVGSVYGSEQGSPGTVNVIQSQPDGTVVFIGGDFASVGSMHCTSVCKLDTQTRQWNQVAPGISGQVRDIAAANNQVTVVGDIAVNNNPTFAARTQDSSSWTAMSSSDAISGTPSAVLNGPSNVIVAGSNGSAGYVGTWDGQQYSSLAQLGSSSDIRQMLFMPIQNAPSDARYPPNTDTMLLLVGHLELQDHGNVSAALYDGNDWYPYTMSTKYDGAPGQLQQVFHETRCCTVSEIIHHLPVPAVILISIAISLGVIFFLVAAGLLVLFAKRRNSVKDAPEPMPPYIPGQNRPSSLVAMLDAAQAGTIGAGATAAIAGASAAAAAGPSNEKGVVDTSSSPGHDFSGFEAAGAAAAAAAGGGGGGITAFGALLAAAAGNTSEEASDDNPRLFYAKYPFDAKEHGELGFDTGIPIVVTDMSDNVWWMGCKDDGSGNPISGLFPSNYVTETKPSLS
ncbi:cortical protein marker for cell polarity-domain-containing protein [Zychaea mexicana]|uniref:cortical protein marker for cell polarity-domain-containing protein n=1 Tax=Zychaea mexicana TaxID=64656 RepID=UPI0022FE89EE|nr:cortical protein marker for cell polarity-domain-containing protein [Zychaea mexicana]KAI9484647.1 cortical protein marker for cell polarity-domain-containing protein [Zychaea mexicana]